MLMFLCVIAMKFWQERLKYYYIFELFKVPRKIRKNNSFIEIVSIERIINAIFLFIVLILLSYTEPSQYSLAFERLLHRLTEITRNDLPVGRQ